MIKFLRQFFCRHRNKQYIDAMPSVAEISAVVSGTMSIDEYRNIKADRHNATAERCQRCGKRWRLNRGGGYYYSTF